MPSFDLPAAVEIAPSAWVMRFTGLIRRGGIVLDLACGDGRHSRYLLHRGFRVVAADIDVSGLDDLRGDDTVEIVAVDLETGDWPFRGRQFDGIVVTNYLHRPHFPWLAGALAPAGVLIIETFGAGNEKLGRPRNPAFLLRPGELLEAFGRILHIVAYEHGQESAPPPAIRQRLCAIRGSGPVPL